MYKERYELHKVRSPEDLGQPGKPYCVKHYIPKDGGTWVACGEIKYFATQEEAEEYKEIKERKKDHAGKNKENTKDERSRKKSPE